LRQTNKTPVEIRMSDPSPAGDPQDYPQQLWTKIFSVAVDTPLRRCFDYLAPTEADGAQLVRLEAGTRVRVPFGRQQLTGIIVSIKDQSDVSDHKLKRILKILDPLPVFDAQLRGLLNWAASYYHAPLGEVMATALPKALRGSATLQTSISGWALTEAGRITLQNGALRRAPAQAALLAALTAGPRALKSTASLRSLREKGWVEVCELLSHPELAASELSTAGAPSDGIPSDDTPADITEKCAGPILSVEQVDAVDRIVQHPPGFTPWLLQGVTGSGKTEVYLQLAEVNLAANRQVLVLVPEIGLTPQLVARFTQRFGAERLAVMHSGLSDAARLAAFRDAFFDRARIVLGTRSAIFAPLSALGVIIVDEEHDASYKQQEGVRYSARDLALVRAQLAKIPIVLGSATPSFESLHNVARGRYQHLSLPRRAGGAQAPTLRLLDLRQEKVTAGLATTSLQAIDRHLREGGQVLLYINRRGYAPTLACTACGWIATCQQCDARLTVHRQADALRCHHCAAERSLPRQCPTCGHGLRTVGQGTERVEESLVELFPASQVARLDRDVVRHARDWQDTLSRIRSGQARILVGTQMLAKGHDFPELTLVVVINADQGLFSNDFRAAERLAQTLVQVAGRAGRAQKPGEVLIQTDYPEHPLLRSLLDGGYEAFAAAALQERREAAWPPFSHLAALRASALELERAIEFLQEARSLAQREAPKSLRLLGPAPAPMARRANRYHAQLLLEAPERGALQHLLGPWIEALDRLPSTKRLRWSLDVDPIDLF
jgi:primosomal protein N' (replication factor Y)